MNRKVQIVETETGNVIATHEINLTAVNYDPKDKEWFDMAWDNSVEDGVVNADDRDKYTISFV